MPSESSSSSSSSSSEMGTLTNGDKAIDETSRKRELDNGHVSLDFPLKYKQRRVSVIRDFPQGCGRFAPPLFDAKLTDSPPVVGYTTESLEVGAEGVSMIEGDEKSLIKPSLECPVECGNTELGKISDSIELVKPEEALSEDETLKAMVNVEPVVTEILKPSLECTIESGNPDPGQISDPINSVKPEEALNEDKAHKAMVIVEPVVMEILKPSLECPIESGNSDLEQISDPIDSVKPEEALNEDEALKAIEIVEPVVMEILKDLESKEVVSPLKTLERETTYASKKLNKMELHDSMKDCDGSESNGLLKKASQPDEIDLPTSPMDAVLPETLNVLDKPQISHPVFGSIHRRYPPRRRIFVSRNFPPGCGRNAPELSKEERLKLISSSENQSEENEESSEGKTPLEQMVEGDDRKVRENVQDVNAFKRKLKGKVLKVHGSLKNQSFRTENSSGENSQLEQMVKGGDKKGRENVQDGDAFKSKLKGDAIKENVDSVEVKSGRHVMKPIAEHDQVGAASHGISIKEHTKENNVKPPCTTKLIRSDTKSPSLSKRVDKETVHSVGRSGKESLKLSKDNSSFERKLPGNSEDESSAINQVEGEGVEPSSDRMIVQALMAAPYCPWRQGKRGFKSPPSRGPTGGKGKKHDIQDNSKFLSKKKDGKGNSEEKCTKKKMPPTGKDAYQCTDNQLFLRVEYDPPRHDEEAQSFGPTGGKEKNHGMHEKKDGTENSKEKSTKKKMAPTGKDAYECADNQLVLRDEYDSPGNDEEDENFALVPRAQAGSLSLIPFGLHMFVDKDDNSETVVTRNKVRETLRLFQAIFRKLLRDEEVKSKEQGNNSKRIDLISAKILKEKNKWVNTGKQILGPVPGVEVGDEFHYRVELAIIGLHRPFQSGIDYLKKGSKIVATSIVASGGHDEMDSSDVLIYSGQGGNPVSKEKQAEDQKLERGNLALKNSMDENSPVRVIRGFKETKGSDTVDARGKVLTTYTYDGLYLVERYWQEKGRYGANVFMFRLRRIPGQPELALKEVKKLKKFRVGICVDDISQGKENMSICAINTIDDEKPPPFKYITSMIYPSWYKPTPSRGCECTAGCSDSEKCFCAVKNGGEIPFNYNGAIVEAKPLVYECGPLCKCPPSCHNRVSQHGIKFQLEIFKTELRGWGVRSLTSIPSGSFICEYTGELLEDKEAEQRTGSDEYLFDIGNNYIDPTLRDGLSNLIPPDLQSSSSCETVEDVGFTIDALEYGSVGRFINHSCSPNLYAQNVLYDHDDKRMPHIMLFAAENIPPLQELTYHYNYVVDQVLDSDGNIKKKNCYCGSHECSGRLY